MVLLFLDFSSWSSLGSSDNNSHLFFFYKYFTHKFLTTNISRLLGDMDSDMHTKFAAFILHVF